MVRALLQLPDTSAQFNPIAAAGVGTWSPAKFVDYRRAVLQNGDQVPRQVLVLELCRVKIIAKFDGWNIMAMDTRKIN